MPEVDWSILCQDVIIDQETNSVSLIKVIETLKAGPFSGAEGVEGAAQKTTQVRITHGWMLIPIECQLVTLFSRADLEIPEELAARVGCIGPDDQEYENKIDIDVKLKTHLKSRNVIKLPELPIVSDGTHHFVIEIQSDNDKWVEVFRVPFHVSGSGLAEDIKRLERELPLAQES